MGQFKPGQSGNPKGRPKRGRALTEILANAGGKGKSKQLAALLWQFVTEGKVKLGDKEYRAADLAEWLQAVKFIYQHIDGGAPQAVELSGPEGGDIPVAWIDRDYRKGLNGEGDSE